METRTVYIPMGAAFVVEGVNGDRIEVQPDFENDELSIAVNKPEHFEILKGKMGVVTLRSSSQRIIITVLDVNKEGTEVCIESHK